MLKYFILLFFLSFRTFSQINSTEIVCNNSDYQHSNASYKDKNGNEYLLYTSENSIDSTYSMILQKWDKNDSKVFQDCGVKLLSVSRNSLNDPEKRNYFNYPISANIQVDDSSNILVVLNINTSAFNLDSLFTLSDIYLFKFDSLGVSKWDSMGIKLNTDVLNGTVENFETLKNGSCHVLLTSKLFYPNSITESKYIIVNNKGNRVYENNQAIVVERTYSQSYSFLKDFYLFKLNDVIFVSSLIYNSTTEFTISTRKFYPSGTFDESSIDIITDEYSLNRIDIQGENVMVISQKDSKGEIRKFNFIDGFDETPTFVIEKMPEEIFTNNQYLIYAVGDSINILNRIQKVDSSGIKYFGLAGIPVKNSLVSWSEASNANDFLLFPDSSIGYVQTHNTILGTNAGFITYLKLTNKNKIQHSELKVNDPCEDVNEYLIKAFIDDKDSSLNLYYYQVNRPILRQNFYNFPLPPATFCPPISVQINRN
ncbi:hypothetical protein EGI26_15440 [Lacihabitans sp. CCS-44]|uniref:hypothetical protein n=1 Tax=Lacihabitans sp. CCS-44 TaxID=2487331 RepID=UPI0020CBE85D|nr:hypothetical protein [Lacihabitans sp. CCS-44]MCP9756557.1 hypothetical protein [Lacihabitans sp. CCS-44]